MPRQSLSALQTPAQLDFLADKLGLTLKAGLSRGGDTLERPYVLSQLIRDIHKDSVEGSLYRMAQVQSSLYGEVARSLVDDCLEVHQTLVDTEHLADNPMTDKNGHKCWLVANRELEDPDTELYADLGLKPAKVKVKAFAVQCAGRNYLVVLNGRTGAWHLHVRRFWLSWEDIQRRGNLPAALVPLVNKTSFSFDEAMTLSRLVGHELCDQVDEDLPQGRLGRPGLDEYLQGDLIAKSPFAGRGLRYGDIRDCGYILSTDLDDLPEVKSAAGIRTQDLSTFHDSLRLFKS